jgi:hypothetical protein
MLGSYVTYPCGPHNSTQIRLASWYAQQSARTVAANRAMLPMQRDRWMSEETRIRPYNRR